MSTLLSIASGWTGPLGPFTLKADGVPLDLSGLVVSISIRKYDGSVVTPGGTLTPDPDQATNPGKVMYSPAATDFVWTSKKYGAERQSYYIRFKVVDALGKVVYFPNAGADEIGVYKV